MRVAGIMSGTSLDGIDVAIIDITGSGYKAKINVLTSHSVPYPRKVREALLGISNANTHTSDISRLNFLLGELYAEAVEETAERGGIPLPSIKLIGCHGQTIYHEGQSAAYLGKKVASTLQIGESSVISERTGISVISNFRERDMAAGGKGAPLVPYLDYLLLRSRGRGRVAVNIGGIANLTAIPPNTNTDKLIAFDTGPGNMVIDQLVSRITLGRQTFDRDGVIAAPAASRSEAAEQAAAGQVFSRQAAQDGGTRAVRCRVCQQAARYRTEHGRLDRHGDGAHGGKHRARRPEFRDARDARGRNFRFRRRRPQSHSDGHAAEGDGHHPGAGDIEAGSMWMPRKLSHLL